MKEIVAQKKWLYTLYKTEKGLVLSVLCGGVGMYEVDVLLTSEEAAKIQHDLDCLDVIAEKVRNAPKEYLEERD